MKVDGTEISWKRQSTFFLRSKKTKEKENNIFFNDLTTKGQHCIVRLPEFETGNRDGVEKLGAAGVGYLAFGVVGGLLAYAGASGTKSKKKTVQTKICIFEKGIQIYEVENGENLRILWENIVKVTYEKPYFTILTNNEVTFDFSFGNGNYDMETKRNIGDAKKLINKILDYCNHFANGEIIDMWEKNQTPSSNKSFCSNCGTKLNNNPNFCSNCGIKIK